MLWLVIALATQVVVIADRSSTESQGTKKNGKTADILSTDASRLEENLWRYKGNKTTVRSSSENAAHAETATVLSLVRDRLLNWNKVGGNTSAPIGQFGQAPDAIHRTSFAERARRESVYFAPSEHQVSSLQVSSLEPTTDGPDGKSGKPSETEDEPGDGDPNKEVSSGERDAAVGATLGGLYVFLLCFFALTVYMLNFPDPQVKSYSNKAIHLCVCIFCTLLTTECVRETLVMFLEPLCGHWGEELSSMLLFFGWYCMISVVACQLLKTHPGEIFATLSMVGHLCAFTAIEPVMEVTEEFALEMREEYGWPVIILFYLSVMLTMVPILLLLHKCAKMIRDKVWLAPESEPTEEGNKKDNEAGSDAGSEGGKKAAGKAPVFGEHRHEGSSYEINHCVKEIVETENEVFALIVGKLLFICMFSCCVLDAYTPNCTHKEWLEVCEGYTSIFFKINVFLSTSAACACTWFSGVLKWRKEEIEEGELQLDDTDQKISNLTKLIITNEYVSLELLEVVEGVARATAAFLLHDCSYFVFAKSFTIPGGRAGRKFLSAAVSTPIAFSAIIVLDYWEDHGVMSKAGVETLAQSVGMFIGFEWEDAFASGCEAFDKYESSSSPLLLKWATSIILASFVIPVWRKFVVPIACKPVPHNE